MENKGKAVLPQYVENAKGNFRIPYGTDITEQQKLLINALWRASTSVKKVEALNALCYYFSNNKVEKVDFSYFVIFEGTKAGVYDSWNMLQKAVGKKNTPRGWKGFYTLEAALHSLERNKNAGQVKKETTEKSE